MSTDEEFAQAPPPSGRSGRPSLRGRELLDDPLLNKGTAFTEAERTALGLHGPLPPQIETLDEQVVRAWEAYQRKSDDLERYIYLRALQDANEILFYRLLLDHMEATGVAPPSSIEALRARVGAAQWVPTCPRYVDD